MKRQIQFWMVSLSLCFLAAKAAAYELNNLGAAGGWKNSPITTVLDRSDYTLDLGSDTAALDRVDAALQRAFDTWAAVDANDRLAFERLTDAGGNYDVFDGPGGALDQGADWRYADITVGGWEPSSYFESLQPGGGSNILAVAWTAKLRGGGSNKPTWTAEILFNDGFNWSDNPGAGQFDIETVGLHEFGHGIGFGHEEVEPSVMQPFYGGVNRALYPDDEAAVAALYSGGGGGKKGGGGGNGGGPPGGGPPGRNKIEFDGWEWTLTGITYVDNLDVAFSTVANPEPSTFALTVLALLGLGLLGWRRRE